MNVSKKVLTGVLCVGLLGSTAQSEAGWKTTLGVLGLSTAATVVCAQVASYFGSQAKRQLLIDKMVVDRDKLLNKKALVCFNRTKDLLLSDLDLVESLSEKIDTEDCKSDGDGLRDKFVRKCVGHLRRNSKDIPATDKGNELEKAFKAYETAKKKIRVSRKIETAFEKNERSYKAAKVGAWLSAGVAIGTAIYSWFTR